MDCVAVDLSSTSFIATTNPVDQDLATCPLQTLIFVANAIACASCFV